MGFWRDWYARLPILHLLVCIIIQFGISDAEEPWKWIPLVILDLPLSVILLPLRRALPDSVVVPGWVVFGVIGTLWWALLCWILWRRGKALAAR
jgi:hypothetical protein